MEILILLGLVLLNGLFAMSEIALIAARKARLTRLAEDGDRGARTALKLAEEPTRFLSAIQIGITSIGILNGIVGEQILAAPVAAWLKSLSVPPSTAEISATIIVVVVITYVSIVIGELVPKRLGQMNPEAIARLVAGPMNILSIITRPFVILLSGSTRALLLLVGARDNGQEAVTEEEIHALLKEGSDTGVIEQNQHDMVRNVFRLDDRHLGSLMIPRSDIVFLDVNLSPEQNIERMIASEYSRFPICDGDLNGLLGVAHAKTILAAMVKEEAPDFRQGLAPCVFLPETLSGTELLEQFRSNNVQMAFVIDEYGEVKGIVTLQDLLEAVTGEFKPQKPEDSWAVQRDDGSWLLDGTIPIAILMDTIELRAMPGDKASYYTLAGMALFVLGRLPNTGEHFDWEGWRFEIVDMDGRRIDKILAARL